MDNPSDFFQAASANFGANVTHYGRFALGYANSGEAEAAYKSRVRSTQANGAGPNADPVNAPWNFTDFAFGRRTVTRAKQVRREGFSLVSLVLFAVIGYFVWKKFLR